MSKWRPIDHLDFIDIGADQVLIFTLKNNKGELFVATHGAWACRKIAYKTIDTRNMKDWHSVYRGDDPPQKDDSYLVLFVHKTDKRPLVAKCYYISKEDRFCGVPENYEMFAYMPVPKPYIAKGGTE